MTIFYGGLATLLSIVVLVLFLDRYVVGFLVRKIWSRQHHVPNDQYEPTAEVVVPMYNEGERITHTIRSLIEQDYPASKLRITIVDDGSSDDSFDRALKAGAGHSRIRIVRNTSNMGKRQSINRIVRESTSEIIISVDSDVVLAKDAVRKVIRCFIRPEIAAVGGRVYLANQNQNWLTRMQAVRYYLVYNFLKNIEMAIGQVLCLSGCLTAYRRQVLLDLIPLLENRNILGIPIKYGEDRYLTRQIIEAGYMTTMTLDARSYTVAPHTVSGYLQQQLRWRRSNIVDVLTGVWKLGHFHPLVAIHYLLQSLSIFLYPLLWVHAFMLGGTASILTIHVGFLAVLVIVYWFDSNEQHENGKINPIFFLAMTVIMPVSYLTLTPLALFTLDSGSWETRRCSTPVQNGFAGSTING